jgi:hypothetical protein
MLSINPDKYTLFDGYGYAIDCHSDIPFFDNIHFYLNRDSLILKRIKEEKFIHEKTVRMKTNQSIFLKCSLIKRRKLSDEEKTNLFFVIAGAIESLNTKFDDIGSYIKYINSTGYIFILVKGIDEY